MDELKDELLISKTSYQTQVPDSIFADIPQKNIEVVAGYLQLIIDVTNRKKDINVLEIFKNAKVIFSDTYIKNNDKLWKEHLAGTLREPLDSHFETNIQRALKHLPKRADNDEAANFYKDIHDSKEFLNDLAHMRYDKVAKYSKDKYSIDEQELSEKTFNKICKDLIDRLYAWFVKFCYKET
jgi:hypothetical protein